MLIAYLMSLVSDPNVTGLSLNPDPAIVGFIFTRADGNRIRFTTLDGNAPLDASVQAVLNADTSPAALAAYAASINPSSSALKQAAMQAVQDINTYLTIADTATAAQVRTAVKALAQDVKLIILYLATQVNQ